MGARRGGRPLRLATPFPSYLTHLFFLFFLFLSLRQDIINVSPATLPDYDTKIKAFYEEHIHTDEEIRYVREGSGEPKQEGQMREQFLSLPSHPLPSHFSSPFSFACLCLSLFHPPQATLTCGTRPIGGSASTPARAT